MQWRFGAKIMAVLALGLGVSFAAEAGPIRDLIKNLREKRAGESASSTLQQASFAAGGVNRTVSFYVPSSLAGKSNVPAVFVFHGGGGDADGVAATSGIVELADALGFVVVLPEVVKGQWNDGRSASASPYDDVGYVRTIIGNSSALMGVDLGRVFASGISNGGMFTQRLSCDAADLFSAVAIISANMPSEYQGQCNPSRSLPKVFFNGNSDPIMPWGGGEIRSLKALGLGAGGTVMSHDETVAFWLGKDGCSGNGSSRNLPDATSDGTTVSVSTFSDCSGSTQLEFFEIDGGGHSWPGSGEKARRMAGTQSQDVSATEEMLIFFQGYGL